MLKIVNDPDQHPALKITAAKGLGRIALTANVDPRLKIEIASTLIKELKKKKIHRWYRLRLIEAIGHVDQLLDVQKREPFIIKMLTETLVDPKQDWLVRCEAAKALGRANLGNQIQIDLVCFAIAHLAREMCDPYNKNPKLADWPECYWKLYLAFQPFKGERRQAGLLTKAERGTFGGKERFVKSAYKEIVPLLNHVLSATPRPRFTNQQLSRLDEWLKTNKPDNQSVLPGLAPLALPPVPTARPAMNNQPRSAARSTPG